MLSYRNGGNMTLTQLVQFEINERGVPVTTLAKKTGCTQYLINQLLAGKQISHDRAVKVANYFGYELKTILIKKGEK